MTSHDSPVGPGGAPATKKKNNTFADDLFASLVVFLVALPLSMGIALASGAPVASGLIAAVCGGILVGVFGGAPLLVSGPAAGLSVMVFGFIAQLGFEATCLAVVAAGVIQWIAGFSGTARLALAISPAVIHGMLAGIGILITLSQLHVVLGGSPFGSAWLNIKGLPQHMANASPGATALGILTIVTLLAWQAIPAKKLKLIPSQLVAVVLATGVSLAMSLDVPRVQFAESIFSSIHLPIMPAGELWGAFVVAAISLAIVASAESLLSAIATDKLHSGPRADLDKELMGQGLANVTSGLIGGLPITGVIVRSAANISAGAKTKLSAIMHGVWLLLFVTQLNWIIVKVPLAVLGGLLVYVGVRLVDRHHIQELRKRGELPIYVATVLGVVGINLLAGIAIGIGLAFFRVMRTLARVQVTLGDSSHGKQVTISGALTFVAVPRFNMEMAAIPPGSSVALDLCVDFLDHAGFEALHTWRINHEKTGGKVTMEALEDFWARKGSVQSQLAGKPLEA